VKSVNYGIINISGAPVNPVNPTFGLRVDANAVLTNKGTITIKSDSTKSINNGKIYIYGGGILRIDGTLKNNGNIYTPTDFVNYGTGQIIGTLSGTPAGTSNPQL
jgi:hypothetical protein